MSFKNRSEAGKELAKKLTEYQGDKHTVVVGLPRGGVVVVAAVASELNLPLDIVVARKIGAPGNSELAIGAITEEGIGFLDQVFINAYEVPLSFLEAQEEKEQKEALRRLALYRGDRPALNLTNKTVILVDDGIATGFTMRAAIASIKSKKTKKIVMAVPVGSSETFETLEEEVDEVVVVEIPKFFHAVGEFYEDFSQVTDEEVIALLQ